MVGHSKLKLWTFFWGEGQNEWLLQFIQSDYRSQPKTINQLQLAGFMNGQDNMNKRLSVGTLLQWLITRYKLISCLSPDSYLYD